MGANNSSAKKETLVNLTRDQISSFNGIVRKRTAGSTLSYEDLKFLLPHWGSFSKVAYDNVTHQLGKKEKLPIAALLRFADLLEGIATEQAEALQILFGDRARAALVECSLHTLDVSAEEAAPLRDILVSDPTPSLSSLLTSNRVASQLVHLPFAHLLGETKTFVPTLYGRSTLLSRVSQVVLRAHLPVEFRDSWQLLFSSNEHGASFSQLSQRIDGQGPCLVVVRSSTGRVFGCFASQGFTTGPTYTGDSLCFLFTLTPTLRVFEPTGFNSKYCYLNYQQDTLPNGLGIGGAGDTWPFFICEDYGKGLSCSHSSSFEKCHLAGEDVWMMHTTEVWRVCAKSPTVANKGKSILDKDPQAQALLELAGKRMHSDGFREPAPILSTPENEAE